MRVITLFCVLLYCSFSAITAQTLQRIDGSPYPYSTPPDTLYLTSENYTYSQRIALQSLQGVLAKTKPEILRDIHEEVLLRNEIDGFMTANLDMLCVVNLDAVFLKVNPHFADVMEMDIEELTHKSFYEFIHPEDIETTKGIMSQLAEGNPIRGFVNRYRKRDGEFLNIEWSATAKENLIYASGQNITTQIRSSQEIRQTNEELRRLTDKLGETNIHLERAATTDELTGIYNRHYFEIKVTELMDAADNDNSSLSLIKIGRASCRERV